MKWVTFISLLFLFSSAYSRGVFRRDAHTYMKLPEDILTFMPRNSFSLLKGIKLLLQNVAKLLIKLPACCQSSMNFGMKGRLRLPNRDSSVPVSKNLEKELSKHGQ
ncbi:albumin [Homo sapiens]|uniref:Albumin n=1 Tax=Homo sapiens TaxID=9606 RepID=D6RCE7_HUMAN|nr:albumin [Homo sapiens]KAI4025711.1 albumin [Homo sapiens]